MNPRGNDSYKSNWSVPINKMRLEVWVVKMPCSIKHTHKVWLLTAFALLNNDTRVHVYQEDEMHEATKASRPGCSSN